MVKKLLSIQKQNDENTNVETTLNNNFLINIHKKQQHL
jgi:hypothetical protein